MAGSMTVGFIGIGNMGWPVAANLVKAGFRVAVYDADNSAAIKGWRDDLLPD